MAGISKKSREEIKLMKEAGHVVALVHQKMREVVTAGISTKELDDIALQIIKQNKCVPTFLGYHGFPGCICASVNEQVVHGIPSEKCILKEGDIISIDVGATFRGLVGDSAWTYAVGKISAEKQHLLDVTEKALFAGISQMKDMGPLENVGAAIEDVANENGVGLVREYGGHGVGRDMHEAPFVYNYRVNSPVILRKGMTIAIEPMLNLGCDEVMTLDDEWTVVTRDSKPSAHFEHTVLVTDGEPEILTKLHG